MTDIKSFVDGLRNMEPGYSRVRRIDADLAAQIIAMYDAQERAKQSFEDRRAYLLRGTL